MERVISLENAMLAAFRPKRYDGPVLLLKASEPEAPPPRRGGYPQGFLEMLQATQAQPDNYWGGTATHLTVRPVTGTHGALMSGAALVGIAEAISQICVPSTAEDSPIMGSTP